MLLSPAPQLPAPVGPGTKLKPRASPSTSLAGACVTPNARVNSRCHPDWSGWTTSCPKRTTPVKGEARETGKPRRCRSSWPASGRDRRRHAERGAADATNGRLSADYLDRPRKVSHHIGCGVTSPVPTPTASPLPTPTATPSSPGFLSGGRAVWFQPRRGNHRNLLHGPRLRSLYLFSLLAHREDA